MTREEAKEVIREDALYNPECAAICLKALELRTPKAPGVRCEGAYGTYPRDCCPNCSGFLSWKQLYCSYCGQAILWKKR